MNSNRVRTAAPPSPAYRQSRPGDAPRGRFRARVGYLAGLLLAPTSALGFSVSGLEVADLSGHWTGIACLVVFALAYGIAAAEERTGLHKSKPMILAAGVIWTLVAVGYLAAGHTLRAEPIFKHTVETYTELFLFLLAAMTYVNALGERGVFAWLADRFVRRGHSLRGLFWATGAMTFLLSAIADNLTTALLMAALVAGIGAARPAFVAAACVNLVVAANAGGVFSPFGDISTLMVWQRGVLQFEDFFRLVPPALVTWLVPALLLARSVPDEPLPPPSVGNGLEQGAAVVAALFAATIGLSVVMERFLQLPAVLGMMTGLGALKLYGYLLKRRGVALSEGNGSFRAYDIFHILQRAEWDTLMFLFGIFMCVGGLGAMGYLAVASAQLYDGLGATWANVLLGMLSALVEGAPMMFFVLGMGPALSDGQWLLVTLTIGIGGSLLAIGSSAGIAAMGQARGVYTFARHLRWSWAIALGFAAGIGTHLWLNAATFRTAAVAAGAAP